MLRKKIKSGPTPTFLLGTTSVTTLTNRIEQFLQPALAALGFQIVRVLLSGRKRPCLQVMIERMDLTPLTMENCVQASREISLLLDAEDPIDGPYRLEVTSPGLDRPLIKATDYQRFIGEKIKIQTVSPIEGRRNFTGVLIHADTEACELHVDRENTEQQVVRLVYTNIAQARLDPDEDFKTLIKKGKAKKND
jgi:ribosome maturation factor RimP